MKEKLLYYFKIWVLMSKNSLLGVLQNRFGVFVFTLGKILRFAFFMMFLVFLLKKSGSLAGFGLNQTVFFFLTFNLVDTAAQFLYREVYNFRSLVVEGSFDLILVKPWSALFRSLMGGADFLDLFIIPPLVVAIYIVGKTLNPSFVDVVLYFLLVMNGLLVATAFHIAVISLGILTLEIDHTVMIYRDLTSLGRFPVDIYREPLRGVLTFLVPVGIMMTLPAKALMGLVSPLGVATSFGVALSAIFLSIKFWHYALRYYTSASS